MLVFYTVNQLEINWLFNLTSLVGFVVRKEILSRYSKLEKHQCDDFYRNKHW
jgi:hypothetical protein